MAATAINSSLVAELEADFAASASDEEQTYDNDPVPEPDGDEDGDSTMVDASAGKQFLTDQRWQELDDILDKIAIYKTKEPSATGSELENDPQYQLLAKANSFSTTIDDHVQELLKRVRDFYSARFPELETLLPDPMEYTKTVAIIGNGPMEDLKQVSSSTDNLVGQPLTSILSRPKLMSVTVEATTTRGSELSEKHMDMTLSTCAKTLKLEAAKTTIQDFVESRMSIFCPNLTVLLGSHTAAQLVTARGGLKGLAETRSANIASIGSKRFAASGFATNTGIRNQGHLYNSELLARFRPELKVQAMRIISGKLVLAARIDLSRTSLDGSEGVNLLEQCEKRLDKLTQAAPNKGQRALPAPDDKPSKKRGGRRARMAKEATAMTDMRKAQNRMRFGQEEADVGYGMGDATAGLGMVGQGDDGRVRAIQVDNRTRAKLSKRNAGWGSTPGAATSTAGGPGGTGLASSLRGIGSGAGAAAGLRTHGVATSLGGTGTTGTASSLAFGAAQGLELVDPKVRAEMERKAHADSDRWFKGGTFTQISNGAGADGFKKPSLPQKRKAAGDP